MDKPLSTAPPRHRRYPRRSSVPASPPAPPALPIAGAAAGRRWPTAVPERRVFPRG